MKEIGLWINRREAIIVIFTGDNEEIKNIRANDAEDFYGEVASVLHDVDSIRIFGPDEAKDELKKRLDSDGIENVTVDTTAVVKNHQHL